ncbi:hypothetical protein ON010_g14296 [Phytophthora cinnamomi]|nr:hypothetical protein ON010_g14296 [Phytophthora cinnamomi]
MHTRSHRCSAGYGCVGCTHSELHFESVPTPATAGENGHSPHIEFCSADSVLPRAGRARSRPQKIGDRVSAGVVAGGDAEAGPQVKPQGCRGRRSPRSAAAAAVSLQRTGLGTLGSGVGCPAAIDEGEERHLHILVRRVGLYAQPEIFAASVTTKAASPTSIKMLKHNSVANTLNRTTSSRLKYYPGQKAPRTTASSH